MLRKRALPYHVFERSPINHTLYLSLHKIFLESRRGCPMWLPMDVFHSTKTARDFCHRMNVHVYCRAGVYSRREREVKTTRERDGPPVCYANAPSPTMCLNVLPSTQLHIRQRTKIKGFRRGCPMWLPMGVFHSTKTARYIFRWMEKSSIPVGENCVLPRA